MSKYKLDLSIDLVPSTVMLVTEKKYDKYCTRYNLDMKLTQPGLCTEIINNDTYEHHIVIGINTKLDDIYLLKSNLVHELSHAVTYLMSYYGFECDEFRSYLLGLWYRRAMKFIDNLV